MLARFSLISVVGVLVAAAVALFSGCGGSQIGELSVGSQPDLTADNQALRNGDGQLVSWPVSLPTDFQQPWEELDEFGYVIPDDSPARLASALNLDSEFAAGVDRFAEAGNVTDNSQASSVGSGSVGLQQFSYATYRLEMAGAQPGVIAVDINLKPRDDGTLSDYWLGLSNYAAGVWQWHGPFIDGQARLSLEAGDYLSGLGNTFVAIAAFNGAAFDVVGVAANAVDELDIEAPPAPDAPLITPVTGGVLLVWLAVPASDVAGYYVYYSTAPFVDEHSTGVRRLSYLEASRRHVLHRTGEVYVRLTAVDISGNESEMSEMVSATALAGEPLAVILETDQVSGLLGDTINLTATGANSYDFDLNGDGVYEITGDLTGMAVADTQSTGIIRPKVRASDNGGSAKALGSVSLIIAAQIPPVASMMATPSDGVFWREPETVSVTFDASMSYDQDGTSLEYAFDPLGDGSFTAFSPTDNYMYEYAKGGTYLAAVKVQDDDGLVDYGFAQVTVRQVTGFYTRDIDPFPGKGQYSSMAIVDGNPAIVTYDAVSTFLMYMRATDSGGNLWAPPMVIDNTAGAGYYTSLQVIAGNPAVSYYNNLTNTVYYLRADNPQGTAWTNAPVVIEGPISCTGTSLADVNGNPAVAYDDAGILELRYRRATSAAATGDTPADWVDAPFSVDNSGNIGGFPSLAVISGNAAVAYWDSTNKEALYKRAVTATGAASGDWPVLAARASPGGVTTDGHITLLEVNGRPAVSFHEDTIGSLQFVRALNTTGSITADWPLVSVQVASGGDPGQHSSMAIVGGRPGISYIQTSPFSLMYSRAIDADGSAFEPPILVYGDVFAPIGWYTSLEETDGLPAFSYYNLFDSTIGFATPIIY